MTPRSPLEIRLRSGEILQAQKLGMSGYVAHPMGGLILGGSASRDHVGKFCVGVYYLDGEPGLIAQEEIAEIRDARGKRVAFGNAKYPGHPDFDPRKGFDPRQEAMETLLRASRDRARRDKEVSKKGQAAVLEEEIKRIHKMFAADAKEGKKKKKKHKSSSKKKSGKSQKKSEKAKKSKDKKEQKRSAKKSGSKKGSSGKRKPGKVKKKRSAKKKG